MFWRVLIDDVNLSKSTSRSARSSVISMRVCTMSSLARLSVLASSSRSIFVSLRRESFASTLKIVFRRRSHSTRILSRRRRRKWRRRKRRRRRSRKRKRMKRMKKREKRMRMTKLTMMTRKTTTSTFEQCRSLSASSLKFRFLSSSTSDRLVSSRSR